MNRAADPSDHDGNDEEEIILKMQQSAISEAEDVECRSIHILSTLHIEFSTAWMLLLCPYLKALPTDQTTIDDEEEMNPTAAAPMAPLKGAPFSMESVGGAKLKNADSDRLDDYKQPLLSSLPAPVTPDFGAQQTANWQNAQSLSNEAMATPPPSYEVAAKWHSVDRHRNGRDHEEELEMKWTDRMRSEYGSNDHDELRERAHSVPHRM